MSDLNNLTEQEIPTSWELRQLVKSGLYPDERAALRSALRALFQLKPEARVKIIVDAYASGEISLGRAAAHLGISQEEMKDVLRDQGAFIHLGPGSDEELRQDVGNA